MVIHSVQQHTSDPTVNLALDTLQIKKQALIFVGSKRAAEKQAEDIAKKIQHGFPHHVELAHEALKALSRPTPQCERLALCLKKGIAFHHAGLHSSQKTLIEEAFKKGHVKIICCTPTLAAGVDLPAYRAIIRDLKRYGGRFGMAYIPVLEYLQMVGRAGRPSYDDHGQGIVIAKTETEAVEIKKKYLEGSPESIYSKLAVEPVLRTYVLSLIASQVVKTKEQILDFFSRTFWAHQYHEMGELGFKITKTLSMLTDWEFLHCSQEDSGFVSGDQLMDENYTATALGRRVAELYLDPLTAHNFVLALRRAKKQQDAMNEKSFLHLVSNTLEMRPLLSIKAKEWEKIQEQSLSWQPYVLESEPSLYDPDYEDYLEALKTALLLHEWMEEKDELALMQEYDVRPGESHAKIDIALWLLTSLAELCRVADCIELVRYINKTKIRLEYGVKEELLALIRLRGIGRIRARKLFKNGIKDMGDLKQASLTTMEQLLGKETARKIKEQVENPAEPVPKGTRKGQLSIEKFNNTLLKNP